MVIAALRVHYFRAFSRHDGFCLVEAFGDPRRGLGCGLLLGAVEGLRHLLGGQVAGTAGLPGCCAACCGLTLCGLHERGALCCSCASAERARDVFADVRARGCAR